MEKDRFGEKNGVRGAIQRGFYFAAKDRELIEMEWWVPPSLQKYGQRLTEMKAHFQKVEAATREGRAQTCPKCSGKLETYRFIEFILDRCESCEGIWLDKGELEGILRRAARGPLGAFFDRCFSKDETGKKS